MKYESKFKTGDRVIFITYASFKEDYKDIFGYVFREGCIGKVIFGSEQPYYTISNCNKEICESDIFALDDEKGLFSRLHGKLKERK